jgi:hypothetical protein
MLTPTKRLRITLVKVANLSLLIPGKMMMKAASRVAKAM